MGLNRTGGLIAILVGLIFIVFPIFSSDVVSIIVGISLLFFGIYSVIFGWNIRRSYNVFYIAAIIMGIISIIFGILFLFFINGLSFLIGLQFYIVGLIMIFSSIAALLSKKDNISNFSCLLVLLIGVLAIIIGIFANGNPIFIAILIGVLLIIEGVRLVLSD